MTAALQVSSMIFRGNFHAKNLLHSCFACDFSNILSTDVLSTDVAAFVVILRILEKAGLCLPLGFGQNKSLMSIVQRAGSSTKHPRWTAQYQSPYLGIELPYSDARLVSVSKFTSFSDIISSSLRYDSKCRASPPEHPSQIIDELVWLFVGGEVSPAVVFVFENDIAHGLRPAVQNIWDISLDANDVKRTSSGIP